MKPKTKWLKIDAVLGKPHSSHKAKLLQVTQAELGRWVAAHLELGYTVTLTKVEQANDRSTTGQPNLRAVSSST